MNLPEDGQLPNPAACFRARERVGFNEKQLDFSPEVVLDSTGIRCPGELFGADVNTPRAFVVPVNQAVIVVDNVISAVFQSVLCDDTSGRSSDRLLRLIGSVV